jgi:hypothetical protein
VIVPPSFRLRSRRLELLALSLLIAALLALWPLLAPARPAPPTGDAEQIRRALAEARSNCLVADLLAAKQARDPLFQTDELIAALRTDRVLQGAYGELPALEREARWIASLRTTSDLRSRSWEDVRFLVGTLHWYLEGCLEVVPEGEGHHKRPSSKDRRLDFRGLTPGDLLDRWD